MSATRYLADRLWTGTGALIRRGAVDVVDGVVTQVGVASGLAPLGPSDVERDLGDVTLLPGLIDSHVHVTFSTTPDVVEVFEREQRMGPSGSLLDRAAHNLGVALDAGITTVRDLGTPSPIARLVRRRLTDGSVRGPSFITSASPLTTPGGHCHFLSHEILPDADPVQAVDLAVESGADLIKVFASGGNLTPGSSPTARQFDREMLAGVVSAAHRRGLTVAAHAFGADSVADCAAVGVDTIEHCAFFTPDGVHADPTVIARMTADGTIAVPTMGDGPAALMAMDVTMAPPAIRDKIEVLRRTLPLARDVLLRMLDAGVSLTSGTDAGIPQRPFDSLAGSIGWFGAADGLGMTAAEALATGTSIAARACGLEDRGLLAAGMRADLLAVRGNPLADLADLRQVAVVVLAGDVVVDRLAIDVVS